MHIPSEETLTRSSTRESLSRELSGAVWERRVWALAWSVSIGMILWALSHGLWWWGGVMIGFTSMMIIYHRLTLTRSEMTRWMDQKLKTRGLIECAWDHRMSSSASADLMTQRALRSLRTLLVKRPPLPTPWLVISCVLTIGLYTPPPQGTWWIKDGLTWQERWESLTGEIKLGGGMNKELEDQLVDHDHEDAGRAQRSIERESSSTRSHPNNSDRTTAPKTSSQELIRSLNEEAQREAQRRAEQRRQDAQLSSSQLKKTSKDHRRSAPNLPKKMKKIQVRRAQAGGRVSGGQATADHSDQQHTISKALNISSTDKKGQVRVKYSNVHSLDRSLQKQNTPLSLTDFPQDQQHLLRRWRQKRGALVPLDNFKRSLKRSRPR